MQRTGGRLLMKSALAITLCVTFTGAEEERSNSETAEAKQTAASDAEPPKPTAYGHGLGLGARTTLPSLPLTAAAVSYDFYRVRIEGAFGMRFAPDDARNPSDLVAGFITVSLPVHRLGNADLSLTVGPGVTYEYPGPGVQGNRPDSRTTWLALAGARVRVFSARQFALIGTLGGGMLIESSGAVSWFIGAQPFGAIGFYYYLR